MTYAFPVNSDIIDYDDNGRPIGDRVFNADDLAEVVETFFSNGVIMREDSFSVAPSDGMSVIVGKGRCIIEGRGKSFPEPKTMVLQAADPTYDRMDTIVLRWNSARAVRDIDLFVKSGTPQLAPVAPTLTRNDQVYELGICNILVPKNSTTVSASRITDTRLDDSRCGVVSALIDVDTTSFFEQLEAATNEAVELSQEALEGTLAGDLQGQITDVSNKVEPIHISKRYDSIEYDYDPNNHNIGIKGTFEDGFKRQFIFSDAEGILYYDSVTNSRLWRLPVMTFGKKSETVNQGARKSITVSVPGMTSNSKVFVSLLSESSSRTASVTSIGSNSFTVELVNGASTASSFVFDWLALI